MQKYTQEQRARVYSDAKDIYNAYKGRIVDGKKFTFGAALKEAWQWLKDDLQEQQQQVILKPVEPRNFEAEQNALLLQIQAAKKAIEATRAEIQRQREIYFSYNYMNKDYYEQTKRRKVEKKVSRGTMFKEAFNNTQRHFARVV